MVNWVVLEATPDFLDLPKNEQEIIKADLREALNGRVTVFRRIRKKKEVIK